MLAVIGGYFSQRFVFSGNKMHSVLLRQQDYINGFNAWLEAPIWGYGYMTGYERFNSGFSNSISQLLIGGGAVLLGIYLLAFFFLIVSGDRYNRNIMFWAVLFLFLFSISIVGYAYISITIVALGYSMYINRGKIIGEKN